MSPKIFLSKLKESCRVALELLVRKLPEDAAQTLRCKRERFLTLFVEICLGLEFKCFEFQRVAQFLTFMPTYEQPNENADENA